MTVIKASNLGHYYFYSAPSLNKANIVATPAPSSAPNVVPVAITTYYPSYSAILGRIGSFKKSCYVSAFFEQTISMWAYKQIDTLDLTPSSFSLTTCISPTLS